MIRMIHLHVSCEHERVEAVDRSREVAFAHGTVGIQRLTWEGQRPLPGPAVQVIATTRCLRDELDPAALEAGEIAGQRLDALGVTDDATAVLLDSCSVGSDVLSVDLDQVHVGLDPGIVVYKDRSVGSNPGSVLLDETLVLDKNLVMSFQPSGVLVKPFLNFSDSISRVVDFDPEVGQVNRVFRLDS